MAKTTPTSTYPMFPEDAAVVVPSNSTDLPNYSTIYVGVAGNVKVTTAQGTVVTFNNASAGFVLPVRVRRVWADSTASSMVAIF
jgi:hypothetical protein